MKKSHSYIARFQTRTQFINYAFFGESSTNQKIKFLNNITSSNDGHKYLYSKEELFSKLQNVGFVKIQEKQKGESDFAELQNLETRQQLCDLTFEAVK